MTEGDVQSGGEGGDGRSFWTSLPAIMTASAVLLGAIVSAYVALQRDGGGGGGAGTSAAGTTSTPAESATQVFARMTRPSGRVYFDGQTMYVRAEGAGRPLLVLAEGEKALEDVGMQVRVEWAGGSRDYGVGLVCRYENAANYYLLSVLSEGRYNIVRYRRGALTSLTRGIQTSGAITGDAHDIAVRCVGDDPTILKLSVDGREIASVRDAGGIESGTVGVRVGGAEAFVTCRFDGFKLTAL